AQKSAATSRARAGAGRSTRTAACGRRCENDLGLTMKLAAGRFLGLLALNLLASYLPAFLWVPSLPGTFSVADVILFSPVIWVFPSGDATVILGVYFLLLVILALALNRWPRAFLIVPGILFVFSFLKGLIFCRIMQGINAIGHS